MKMRLDFVAFPALLLWLFLALLVVGCAPTIPVPVDHFYRLPEATPVAGAGRILAGRMSSGTGLS